MGGVPFLFFFYLSIQSDLSSIILGIDNIIDCGIMNKGIDIVLCCSNIT